MTEQHRLSDASQEPEVARQGRSEGTRDSARQTANRRQEGRAAGSQGNASRDESLSPSTRFCWQAVAAIIHQPPPAVPSQTSLPPPSLTSSDLTPAARASAVHQQLPPRNHILACTPTTFSSTSTSTPSPICRSLADYTHILTTAVCCTGHRNQRHSPVTTAYLTTAGVESEGTSRPPSITRHLPLTSRPSRPPPTHRQDVGRARSLPAEAEGQAEQ